MQLKRSKSIRQQLSIATSSLLVAAPLQAAAAAQAGGSEFENIQIELSQLYYSEDERVNVYKSQALVENELNEDNLLRVNFVYDTMSGSSPNGRIYTDNSDASGSVAVTTASGFSFSTANNGAAVSQRAWVTPFSDTRTALSVEWESSLSRLVRSIITGGASYENDYDSYGTSGTLVWDFNQRRSTLTTGIGFSNDTIRPASGNIPEGLGELWCGTDPIDLAWLSSCDDKNQQVFQPANKRVVDYLVGLTQVWNRDTLFQINYSRSSESGYLTDPYKQVSVIDPSFNNKEYAVLYEKRPDIRSIQSVYLKAVNAASKTTTSYLSYRYFWDDWDVQAHTLDWKLRFDVGKRSYFQPHIRANYQTAAFFSKASIAVNDEEFTDKPEYVSADHRLSEQTTITAGLKYGRTLGKEGKFGIRLEQMRQNYTGSILPNMKAWIVQVLLSNRF